MAILKSIGGLLVSNDEYFEKMTSGEIGEFLSESNNNPDAELVFSDGIVKASDLQRDFEDLNGDIVPFEPIGYGKPLTVAIKNIYTGEFPVRAKRDLLITSAIKSFQTMEGQPKAMNFIKDAFGAPKQHIESIAADEPGTFLVYYVQAVTDRSSTVTFEMITTKFNDELFNTISNVLGGAAKIPVFVGASGFLLAGSIVTRLIGKIGNLFRSGNPFFEDSIQLNFGQVGSRESLPGFDIAIDNSVERNIREKYKISNDGKLVQKDDPSILYEGNEPYVVYYLDGTDRSTDYGAFGRSLITASQLEKFYNVADDQDTKAGVLLEAMGLFNDFKFKNKADEQKKIMESNDSGSSVYIAAEEKYRAFLDNISNDLFKPNED